MTKSTLERQAIYALQNRRQGAKGVDSDTLMTARQRRRCVKKAHHAWAMEAKPKVAPRSIRRSRYAAVRIFRGRRR